METKQVNYTEQQTVKLVQGYQQGVTVEQLAETLGKSVRSVVAKLAREGVYKTKQKASVRAQTKAELVAALEVKLNLVCGSLSTLEKSERKQLQLLVEKLL